MSEMRLVVVGAAGRMGRMLVQAIAATDGCRLSGALERPDSVALGQDAGQLAGCGEAGVAVTDDPLPVFAEADGVLDFTAPAATVAFAELAAQAEEAPGLREIKRHGAGSSGARTPGGCPRTTRCTS